MFGTNKDRCDDLKEAHLQGPKSPEELRKAILPLIHDRKNTQVDALLRLDGNDLIQSDYAELISMSKNPSINNEALWIGNSHQSYGSTYIDFKAYDQSMKTPKGGTVVDLGAGPFRAAVYYGIERPDVKIHGYEFFHSRVAAGQRVIEKLGIEENASIVQKDLSELDLKLIPANGYILMNPFPTSTSKNIFRAIKEAITPDGPANAKILIYNQARQTLQVARETPWLEYKETKPGFSGTKYGWQLFQVVEHQITPKEKTN